MTFEQGLQLATLPVRALEALVAAADADATRNRRRHDHLRRQPQHQFHQRLLRRLQLLRFRARPRRARCLLAFAGTCRAKAREAWDRGATEVCIQGGLPRDLDGFFYRDILRAIKRAIPAMHVHAFSPMEISYGVDKTGMPLRDYLQMLKDEGLGSIPGTAAEILDDRVRRQLSPNKLPVAQWVEIITTAHELGIPSTSTMMYGHVEEPADWVRHILLLRSIQKRTGGFTEFVPARFHSRKDSALSTWRRSRWCRARRSSSRSRFVARAVAWRDQEYSGVVGEARISAFAGLPQRRRERFQRHVDGGKHLEGRRRKFRRVRRAR